MKNILKTMYWKPMSGPLVETYERYEEKQCPAMQLIKCYETFVSYTFRIYVQLVSLSSPIHSPLYQLNQHDIFHLHGFSSTFSPIFFNFLAHFPWYFTFSSSLCWTKNNVHKLYMFPNLYIYMGFMLYVSQVSECMSILFDLTGKEGRCLN